MPVGFTEEQAAQIEGYADEHGIPYGEAVRRIFDMGISHLTLVDGAKG